jgi:hypothetical protein
MPGCGIVQRLARSIEPGQVPEALPDRDVGRAATEDLRVIYSASSPHVVPVAQKEHLLVG